MTSRLITLAREAGFRGLFAGLGPRMIMTAGLVSGQFLIYDGIKHGAPGITSSVRLKLIIVRVSFGRSAWLRDTQGKREEIDMDALVIRTTILH